MRYIYYLLVFILIGILSPDFESGNSLTGEYVLLIMIWWNISLSMNYKSLGAYDG